MRILPLNLGPFQLEFVLVFLAYFDSLIQVHIFDQVTLVCYLVPDRETSEVLARVCPLVDISAIVLHEIFVIF